MTDTAPVFTTAEGKPLPPTSHLAVGQRGKYFMRITVSKDAKLTGERLTIQLRTCDPAIAMQKRDTVLEAYKIAGLICRNVSMQQCEPISPLAS